MRKATVLFSVLLLLVGLSAAVTTTKLSGYRQPHEYSAASVAESPIEIPRIRYYKVHGQPYAEVRIKNEGNNFLGGAVSVSTKRFEKAKSLNLKPGETATRTFSFDKLYDHRLRVSYRTMDQGELEWRFFSIPPSYVSGRGPPEISVERMEYHNADTEPLSDDYLLLKLSFDRHPPVNVSARVKTPHGVQTTSFSMNYPGLVKIQGLYRDHNGNIIQPPRGNFDIEVDVKGVKQRGTMLRSDPDDTVSKSFKLRELADDPVKLPLHKGWNMVSSAHGLKIGDITDDCDIGSYKGHISWQYSGGWNHKRGIPSTQGTFVWARESCEASITQSHADANAGKNLKQGWNIISVPRPMTLNEINGCGFLDYKGTPVWHYSGDGEWQRHGGSVNDLKPDKGYYVYATSSCRMSFSG